MNQAPNRVILLVESQPKRADTCVSTLASLGYDCVVVPDVDQVCAENLQDSHVSLVLLSSQISQPSVITNMLAQIKGSYETPVLLYFLGLDSFNDQLSALDCNGFISMDADPKLILLQINSTILQSQKQTELQSQLAKLSEGELIFKQLVEGMMEGLMVVDNDDVIKYINPKLNELLGYEDQELIGKTGYQILLNPEDGASIVERNKQRQLGISEDYELVMLTKCGEEIIFEMKAAPITNRKGQVTGSMALCLNITDKKLSEQKINSLLQEKDLLLREVHHRIKNNMSTVSGLLALQAMAIDNEAAVEALNDAQSRVLSMMYIYDKLYRSADFKQVSVAEYFSELINSTKQTFKGLCDAEVDAMFGSCFLDSDMLIPLGILFNELLTNSFKYAFPDGMPGKISIRCYQDLEGTHVFEYSDNGIGIPEHYMKRRDDSFGMNLVEMLVQQLGGKLDLSCGPGTHYKITY